MTHFCRSSQLVLALIARTQGPGGFLGGHSFNTLTLVTVEAVRKLSERSLEPANVPRSRSLHSMT
jgi:hypothetical protein